MACFLRGQGLPGAGSGCQHPRSLPLCPFPRRSEPRSAVRIKVLDVLSFVLLMNRQLYEVGVACDPGPPPPACPSGAPSLVFLCHGAPWPTSKAAEALETPAVQSVLP